MSNIGFSINPVQNEKTETAVQRAEPLPRPSVVQVLFENWNRPLAYYNDRFDLKRGDAVFVDGKLAGKLGRVVEVNCNFKIKLSDYKRVIAVADTEISGEFFIADDRLVTFRRDALPYSKVAGWYFPPDNGEEYIIAVTVKASCCRVLKALGRAPKHLSAVRSTIAKTK